MRGGRRDANGPFLAEELTAARPRARPDHARRRRAGGAGGRASRGPRGRPARRLGRARARRTTTAPSSCSRAQQASPARLSPELEQEIEGISRADRRAAQAALRGVRGGRAEAGDCPRGRAGDRDRRHGSRPRGGDAAARSQSSCRALRPSCGALWQAALEDEAVQRVLARAEPPEHRVLRVYGLSESAVARALSEAGGEPEGVQATICAHDGEIWVDLFGDGEELAQAMRQALGGCGVRRRTTARSRSIVLEAARALGLSARDRGVVHRRARGGAADLRPGASDVFRGGIVAYENDVKVARARRARRDAGRARCRFGRDRGGDGCGRPRVRLGADVAVSVTGVAGPGGGTPEKPVGLVYVHASAPGRGRAGSCGCRATARRCGAARPRRRSTSCVTFWHEAVHSSA